MPITKVLARNWKVEIGTNDTTPVWTQIKGLNTLTFSNDKSDTETTDFDSAGHAEHIVTERSHELTVEGYFLEDKTTGERDPGQEAVEEAAEKTGFESLVPIRITSPGGKTKTFKASVVVGDIGGGTNDATSWGATFTVSGPITTV